MYLTKFDLCTFPPVEGSERMFYNLEGGAESQDDVIYLPINSSISLNTFFNNFSASYIKYAHCDNLRVEVVYRGSISVELHYCTVANDIVIAEKALISEVKTAAYVGVPTGTDYEEGFLYLRITSQSDNSVFYGGGFLVDAVRREVKVGIVICTYRREQFIIGNMFNLSDYFAENPDFAKRIGVFVVDNGQTLSANDLPDFVNLIPNENTGGAGGFTRGLKELLAKGNEYTHFLFMDDDLVFMPSVINRTLALISALKDEYVDYSVGGAMFNLSNPTNQHEFGGKWTGAKYCGNRKDVDVSTIEGLLINEKSIVSDFNAWWYMCSPLESAIKYGLPLDKIFVRGDDVEYGLRTMKGLLTISGIGVWHEGFDSKYSPTMEYFSRRNTLIVHSRFPRGKGLFAVWMAMVRAISKALVEYRYFNVEIIERAYRDFLKGADYISGINHKELLKTLKPKDMPTVQPIEFYEREFGFDVDAEHAKSKDMPMRIVKEVLTLNGYLFPKVFYRKVAVVDMAFPKPQNFYCVRKVINYNPHTRQAFVTEIKKTKLLYGVGKIVSLTFAIIFKYRKARKSYRNWTTFFDSEQ